VFSLSCFGSHIFLLLSFMLTNRLKFIGRVMAGCFVGSMLIVVVLGVK
jgi:hypothetical protein